MLIILMRKPMPRERADVVGSKKVAARVIFMLPPTVHQNSNFISTTLQSHAADSLYGCACRSMYVYVCVNEK